MDKFGPEPLSEIVGRLFTARGWGRQESRRRLEEIWQRVVGKEASGGTEIGSLRQGVLEVFVHSPVVLQELAGFRKAELLKALQAESPENKIRDLRFRCSVVGSA